MLVFDTNVLTYAVDEDSPYHDPFRQRVLQARNDPSPAYLTWNIYCEFLRDTTHARASASPWKPVPSWNSLSELLETPGFDLLVATSRHGAVSAQVMKELPDVSGNLFHDLHGAVLMRENGVSRICTRDSDFHRFPFLSAVDSLR